MRAIKQVTIEQVLESENGNLTIEDVEIAGHKYILKISNENGKLSLDFNDRDYVITICEEGVRFDRTVYRRNHDHNDFEHLVVGVDDDKIGVTKGGILWRARFPYNGEGYKFFRIEFGAIRRDY